MKTVHKLQANQLGDLPKQKNWPYKKFNLNERECLGSTDGTLVEYEQMLARIGKWSEINGRSEYTEALRTLCWTLVSTRSRIEPD